jgi:hypothetical protein
MIIKVKVINDLIPIWDVKENKLVWYSREILIG